MKISNVSETVAFPAKVFLPKIDEESIKKLNEFANMQFASKEEKVKEAAKLSESLPVSLQMALTSIGAVLPTDLVPVTVSLGSFLYDAYCESCPAPSAPLAKAAHQKRLQDLAVRLESSEFDLSQEELDVVRKVMENDEKWASCAFSANTGNGDTKKALHLNGNGLSYFPKILEASLALFGG